VATPAAVLGEPRLWQRETGASFTAALRGLEGDKVILQSADGRTAKLELATLSRNDRDYVRGKMGALAQRWMARQLPPSKPAADRSGWPALVRVPQESLLMSVKRSFEAGRGMRFASAHFEFDCPVEVLEAEQRSIATPFELIHEVWRLAPWGVITPPKGGGLFQVELFLHTAAYEAAGAPPNSGCHFDQRTKKLRVLGSAIGLDSERLPQWRDEQSPVPALAYSVSLTLIQKLQHTIPSWFGPGIALVMRELPMCGETARPRELLEELDRATADITLTSAEVRLYLHAANKAADPPLDRDKLRRMTGYLMQGDGSNGRNLADFLTAVAADQPVWEAYFDHLDEWSEAAKKAKSDSAVVVPALAPEPFGITDPADLPWYHLSKLLGTTELESGVRKAITTLKAMP
jgi:hypothetical protein